MRCAQCGRRLVGYEKRKKARAYRYYTCSKHLRGLCAQPQLRERDIHAAVLATMAQVTIMQTDYDLLRKLVIEASAGDRQERDAARQRADAELVAINNQRARLVDLVVDGTLAREDYDRKQREIAEKQSELTLALKQAKSATVRK